MQFIYAVKQEEIASFVVVVAIPKKIYFDSSPKIDRI